MLPEKRLTQLTQMEAILNESNEFLTEAELFLEKWRAFLPRMKKLEDYYFDGDWREDFDAYEQGKIPKDIAFGRLSVQCRRKTTKFIYWLFETDYGYFRS